MSILEKSKKRALRRKFKQRKIERAKKVAHRLFPGLHDPLWEEEWALRHADNLKSCSCWMCGNPRKTLHQETLQEKKFKESIWCD